METQLATPIPNILENPVRLQTIPHDRPKVRGMQAVQMEQSMAVPRLGIAAGIKLLSPVDVSTATAAPGTLLEKHVTDV